MGRQRASIGRLELHELGPRVYLFGRRIHEYQLGIAVSAGTLAAFLTRLLPADPWGLLLFAIGAWLFVKDWRDVFARTRDTARWRPGIHRTKVALQRMRRGERLPLLTALFAAILGLVNLVSALTPDIAWRGHLLLAIEPVKAVPIFHALAVPLSAGLLLAAFYLARRRQRAWQAAFTLLLALAALNVLKGLDVEEAFASLAGAALLWWGRGAFYVRHAALTVRGALKRIALASVAAAGLALALVAAAAPHAGPLVIGRETFALLSWSHGPIRFRDETGVLPPAIGLVDLAWLGALAWMLFRPLAGPRALPDHRARRAAAKLVVAHGRDTLAFFKLRRDNQLFFGPDEHAFVAYRISNGVLLVSGDPVGPPEALPGLMLGLRAFAEERGLRLAVLGASEEYLPVYAELGLRSLYMGDEAIVDTASFSLEGRPIRKVRQSVTRLEKASYTASLARLDEIEAVDLAELEAVAERWRGGAPDRGFSMAMDGLRGEGRGDTLLVIARDGEGRPRGYLHFVPVYGRPAVSLAAMPRDRDTPNGLSEFLVARGMELLRDDGTEEASLNFAAFARLMHAPRNRADRALGRAIRFGNPYFQIESLYRFNAKFFPRWAPRYLVYESALSLPRAGIAALLVEGQVTLPRFAARRAYVEA
jgi:lysyl-tRNA synthetase, class II